MSTEAWWITAGVVVWTPLLVHLWRCKYRKR
jgi:hypothetical protein